MAAFKGMQPCNPRYYAAIAGRHELLRKAWLSPFRKSDRLLQHGFAGIRKRALRNQVYGTLKLAPPTWQSTAAEVSMSRGEGICDFHTAGMIAPPEIADFVG